ncbi:guanine nucleotide exchange factor spike 1 [Quercus suber]|uniref:Guanine nucleotide exchange factor spike 1 n=1 Tax=Quercus suber TaxID=58331 RepID=A0AAW0J1L9_QUESU
MMAASHSISTDYGKLDCITAIFMSFFSRNQPVSFWKALFPVFNNVFDLHGGTLMARENDRFLKQVTFLKQQLLRLAVFQNERGRKRAVIGLQILVKESGEARRLRKSLEEMSDEAKSPNLLRECGLSDSALVTIPERSEENRWSWSEVKYLSDSLLLALMEAWSMHYCKNNTIIFSLLSQGSVMTMDRYTAVESFYKLAMTFAPIPDLHIMWLLHLCDAHQEMQSWAEAAKCAVAVAGVVMQVVNC